MTRNEFEELLDLAVKMSRDAAWAEYQQDLRDLADETKPAKARGLTNVERQARRRAQYTAYRDTLRAIVDAGSLEEAKNLAVRALAS